MAHSNMLVFPAWKIGLVIVVCLTGFLTALPNFFSEQQLARFPSFLPTQQVSLGLDLQGGSHLLLEVDMEGVIAERLEILLDEVRSILRENRIRYTGLLIKDGQVVFQTRGEVDPSLVSDILEVLSQPIINNLTVIPTRDVEIEDLGGGAFQLGLTPEGIQERRQQALSQSIEVIRRRVDALGTREPSIQSQGSDRILVQVPGEQDPGQLKIVINTTARLTFHMVDENISPIDIERGRIPPGWKVLPSVETGIPIVVQRRPMVSGENLKDARPGFDQNGLPAVIISFDITGARKFGEATRRNVQRLFAIVLDDEVISAPRIQEPILGGTAQITGSFTVETANNLAILLRAGALPAELTVLEERTVGPDLGADMVEAGKMAALYGMLAVVLFIILSYGWFGIAANVALFINITIIFGALSALQATLTLPGIAGIVLTIGMAVDANVLVFERIREEVRIGRSPMQAVEKGYSQALPTILDANITTLIAAVILFQFGSGPVKGFAITLAIGIITSVFTAVTVTRLMVATTLRRRRPAALII